MRSEFTNKLTSMSDAEFRRACNQYIWLSAYANNNPRSNYHWQADACYDEARRREKPEIYQQEWQKLFDAASR